MEAEADVAEIADRIRATIGMLRRHLRDTDASSLPLPQIAALIRLERIGPVTSAGLARAEHVSPQSMGATVRALESRGFVARTSDPSDGRRILLSATKAGSAALRRRDQARDDRLARALAEEFSAAELRRWVGATRLLDRLATRLSSSTTTL